MLFRSARHDAAWLSAVIKQALVKAVADHPIPAISKHCLGERTAGQPRSMVISMVLFKVLVAVYVLACALSAATGVCLIEAGPGGAIVVMEHTPLTRPGTALMAVLGAVFLYGLHTRALIAWKAGWVVLGLTGLSGMVSGLLLMLNDPRMNNQPIPLWWFTVIVIIVGIGLFCIYGWLWWRKQRDYFRPARKSEAVNG